MSDLARVAPLLTPREATMLTGASGGTLINWAAAGLVKIERTPGGDRRYDEQDLREWMALRALTSELQAGDVVSCPAWLGGAPVRILAIGNIARGLLRIDWRGEDGEPSGVVCGYNVLVRRLRKDGEA